MGEHYKINRDILVEVPRVPNFIKTQDGESLAVGDLTDDELRSIAVCWTTALLNNAERQRTDLQVSHQLLRKHHPGGKR